jgi:hypothetical protein
MKTTMVIVGVVVLILGIALIGYGLAYPSTTTSTTTNSSNSVVSSVSNQAIGKLGTFETGVALSQGAKITGNFSLTNYLPSEGLYFFYVENKSQFVAWGNCSPCGSPTVVNGTASSSGTYSFTFTTPASDTYFFVFDAESYNATSQANMVASTTASTPQTVTSQSLNAGPVYGGLALLAIGAIIAGVGAVMGNKPKVKKQDEPVVPSPSAQPTKTN